MADVARARATGPLGPAERTRYLGQTAPDTSGVVNDCDRLAANPDDPQRATIGLRLHEFNASQAIAACQAAIALIPDEIRFTYQLGRALMARTAAREAEPLLRRAAEAGYGIAWLDLGLIHASGSGTDLSAAEPEMRKAWALGVPAAGRALGDLISARGGADTAEARRLWQEAALQGDGIAHERLAVEAETAGGDDVRRALFEDTVAARLLRDAGAARDGDRAAARAASWARRLPPEDVTKIYRDALAWVPSPRVVGASAPPQDVRRDAP
jgi:TPR repeat protein